MGFLDTPWHTHGNLIFADASGHYIELDYLDLIICLKEGKVLIGEQEVEGRVVDRWLVHNECNDELKYLKPDERIIVYRAVSGAERIDKGGVDENTQRREFA